MKKLIVIALAVVMALSLVLVLAACGEEQTVTGTCSYQNASGTTYGVEVKVTVKGDRITKVELVDHEGWVRTSSDQVWALPENGGYGFNEGDLGYEAAEAAYAGWLEETVVGQKVDTVKGWKATATADGQTITTEGIKLAGATQSAARIIVAIQDALSKLDK